MSLIPATMVGRTFFILLAGGLGIAVDVSFVVHLLGKEEDSTRSWLIVAVIVLLGLVFIAYIVARQLVKPLKQLAETANRFSVDMQAQPLAVRGPLEVRHTAAAFNCMQERIRRFVEERMQTIGAISHDLRTPLTRLRLRVEQLPDAGERAKALADLDDMNTMISSTLSFIRDDAAKEPTQLTDISSLVQTVCDDLADGLGSVDCRACRNIQLWCRPLAIKRALSNLVENAVRYGKNALVTLHADAQSIVVQIDDEGPGIRECELESVFTPFYRLEQSRNKNTGGVGLGLSVARTIVHAHGGELTLENRARRGLRAQIELPRVRV